ncbi:Ppx/GppA family phosphatase [Acetobacter oeni]|uniref:Exopolyphosphatase n=1 Tax=Acetobacter oeni TaxID=304077 RepID=A0A511XK93_9PROT|nr:Ppx/GppA family phosphatase [Acetobacter oeni]MBB3883883.1 exopolyphosphatase/guanosine-5'-triphosphate,3'-diphosphate pyrophosphatase [Acetobacter oeni]NHO19807.1 Ppx/GppA family phosphatase [Acetobacter oeni]GBR03482.1 exopolyphosphatase [Acetobacter oeni LMG 21952]GEN63364.1 exopolyphosphatase [Acetobacter oeni]
MQADPPARSAVVDLGSNSVRMVVFDGISRNPVPIFNEKAVLRLGRGLTTTGRLNEDGVAMAVDVLRRFHAIARGMNASPFEVLATAAVRDATNGPEFVASLRELMPDVPIRILSGIEEADHSALGVLCGIPEANGLVADIGGGSLELIRLDSEGRHNADTLPLGVIRLSDRASGDVTHAKAIADADLHGVQWLNEMRGKTLYLVGGAFRALARLEIARTNYPLNIVHYYTLTPQAARDMTGWLIQSNRRALERLPNAPRKRLDDVPFAATVLRRLIRRVEPEKIVFCVDGLREGWYATSVAPDLQALDPLETVSRGMCARLGRSDTLPDALISWTDSIFRSETPRQRRLRLAACRLSDVGSHDHPEYRAEQTYMRVLWVQGAGFDHQARASLALALAVRYEAEPDTAPYLRTSRSLLDDEAFTWAVTLGLALRLAYVLCGGTETLLDGTRLELTGSELCLHLTSARVAVRGDAVRRRLTRLAQAMKLTARLDEGSQAAIPV